MLAIVNAQVRTCGPQGTIDDGTVLIQAGKTATEGGDATVPDNARVVDARDMLLTLGFADAQAHVGMSWQGLAGEAVKRIPMRAQAQ